MSVPEFVMIQFYRQQPGDIGINDIPVPADRDFRSVAQKALLGYFNNTTIAPQQRPHHARVISHDRIKTLVTLMVTGPKTVERV
ncbi:hypothetical protein AMST5_02903 [freshwater sediment metagenome]|uniref:Uncharacterized protein n=1 Tax=freshwater sediment metagenome TaxID=556182 RepID=A0AA48M4K7_9ZZZZ